MCADIANSKLTKRFYTTSVGQEQVPIGCRCVFHSFPPLDKIGKGHFLCRCNIILSLFTLLIKFSQILRNTLLNQLNPKRERVITKYRLIVEISESRSDLAYRKDMSSTRTDLEVTAKYLLTISQYKRYLLLRQP